ncbi:MAG: hypothetical protein AAF371_15765 [Pseudomonadota bacterium]
MDTLERDLDAIADALEREVAASRSRAARLKGALARLDDSMARAAADLESGVARHSAPPEAIDADAGRRLVDGFAEPSAPFQCPEPPSDGDS